MPTLALDPPAVAEDGPVRSSGRPSSHRGGLVVGLILVHLMWGAFVMWLLLVAVMNAVLATKLVPHLASSSPNSVVLDWRSASTLWPGRVHVEGFHIRGSDDNTEWTLDVERADATIALLDLPRKFFHAPKVVADGAKFRIRRRQPKAAFDDDPRFVAALPPISDRPFPPLSPDPPSPPTEGPDPNVWKIGIDDAHVTHVEQIWADDHEVDGEGEVDGAFSLVPTQSLSVGPLHLTARGLDLRAGKVPVVEHLTGDVFATIGPLDLQTAPGTMIRNFVSADIHGIGEVPNLEVVGYYARRTPLAVHGGAGTMKLDLTIENGVLQPASDLTLVAKGVTAGAGANLEASFDLVSHVKVEGDRAHVRADATSAMLRTTKNVPLAEAPDVAFDIDLGTRALERMANQPGIAVDVGDLGIPHLETWNTYVASDSVSLDRGTLRGRFHAELEPVWSTGRLELSLHGPAAATFHGTHVASGIAVDVKVPSFDLAEARADVSGTRVEAQDVRVDGQSDGPWWGRVEASHATVSWKKAPRFDADLLAQSADARPVLLFLADQGTLPSWVHTVLTLGNARGRAHLSLGTAGVDVDDLVVTASELDTRAFIHVHGGQPKTCVLVSSGPFAVGVDGRAAHPSLVLLGARSWFEGASPCR